MTYRDIVKGYFETGDFPTQAQFWELFDKIHFKDELIAATRITATGLGQINIPADTWIDKIGIIGNVAITLDVGTYPSGNDVLSNEAITINQGFSIDLYFSNAGSLYFTGIVSTTKIIIFTR